ncbi:MAG: putative metalloprotease CJM1_0395 family protein [Alphaproteobacteria bacterium]|jgi:hypothetical protein|nr:putative metalloprotease CJM1_0395 family protein [Alphaproteobacteria bacterium]MDP6566743.1 putative metalloprotease CJM1_0395 family protein [Alphaproteobacteria bacterium]MDP6814703.1 putative metalloprotease CJM1_0395 family protein [Alphaproteobacteria bacterium]
MTSIAIGLPSLAPRPSLPVRPSQGEAPRADRHDHASDKRVAGAPAAPVTGGRPTSPVELRSLLQAQEQTAKGEQGRPGELSEEEQRQVAELRKQDAEVRRHEQAHANAGGQYAGAPSYGYVDGPDGRRYANSGHVPIDVTPVANDPAATIRKMDVVRRAATAPADPSGADRAVAAKAAQERQKAQAELNELRAEDTAAPAGNGDADSAAGSQTAGIQPATAVAAYGAAQVIANQQAPRPAA